MAAAGDNTGGPETRRGTTHRLRALHNAAKEIGLLTQVEDILAAGVAHTRQAFDAEAVILLARGSCYEPGAWSLRCAPPHLPDISVTSHCIVKRERPLGIDDLCLREQAARAFYSDFSFAPIELPEQTAGLIGVNRAPATLEPIELELLCGLSTVVASGIEQARLRDEAVAEERRRLRLSRYFSPQVVEHLLETGAEATCTAERREVTVLFSDVRNFTAMSEHRDPFEVLAILSAHFESATAVVHRHGGMVDKLLGDGMLAVFGALGPPSDHARAALACAADLLAVARELDLASYGLNEGLRIGIGIHSGPVVLGDLGGAAFVDYTVLGATVNLASRIESLTKVYGVDVLFSQATLDAGGDAFSTELVDRCMVRGFSDPIALYRFVD